MSFFADGTKVKSTTVKVSQKMSTTFFFSFFILLCEILTCFNIIKTCQDEID